MTGGELRPDEHYDGERFADVVFDETAAGNCLFLDCSFVNVSFREGRLRKCRFTDTTMREVRIVATDLAETAWQDVTLTGCALAGVQAHSADWRRVVFLEGKLDSVNFRGGTFADVRFENCLLPDADFSGAILHRVSLVAAFSPARTSRMRPARAWTCGARRSESPTVSGRWQAARSTASSCWPWPRSSRSTSASRSPTDHGLPPA